MDGIDHDAPVPDYLKDTYAWAYLNPRHVEFLDHQLVVSTILWGNAKRLISAAAGEFQPGQSVLQPACVYGSLSCDLARKVGEDGYLEVRDIAPVQLAHARQKLANFPQAHVVHADASKPPGRTFDGACCFFLLHEVPDRLKSAVVDAVLSAIKPGGKAVFIDYHRMAPFHPLRPIMAGVFRFLEPFATGLFRQEIRELARSPEKFRWTKRTFFGGLYQKVVAERVA
jgi:ubiquinone/menaquinone biosynthesis C-methylase UbiE